MPREITYETINVEDPIQKSKMQFESKILIKKDGKEVYPDEETDFIFQKYSGFASKKFNPTPDKRDFIKIQIDNEQESCIKLKNDITEYDDCLSANRKIIFGKFDRLYKIGLSVKTPKTDDEEILSNDDEAESGDKKDEESKKIKFDSIKFKLNMAWFYYYNDQRLDKLNSNTIRKAVIDLLQKNKNLDKDKKKALIGTLVFKLKFNEDGKNVEKSISMNDIEQRKEIDTKIFHRRPTSIPVEHKDKDLNKYSEEDLVKYYGNPELKDVRTPDDLDKYYGYNCWIRFIWSPTCLWAAKSKEPDAEKRRAGIKYVIKSIDIIQLPYENLNKSSVRTIYSEYSFGKKSGASTSLLIDQKADTIFDNIEAKVEKVETEEVSKTNTNSVKKTVKIENSSDSDDSNESNESNESSDSDSDEKPEPPKSAKGKKVIETSKANTVITKKK